MVTAIAIIGFVIWALYCVYAGGDPLVFAIIVAPIAVVIVSFWYPAAHGIALAVICGLALLAALIFDWIPKGWRLFVRWFDWLWLHPMDNSTGPRRESEPPDARSHEG
jgi:hypothetical protein